MRLIPLMLTVAVLVACRQTEASPNTTATTTTVSTAEAAKLKYPDANLNTPDQAVKSYWAYQDHEELLDSIAFANSRHQDSAAFRRSIWSNVTAGLALDGIARVRKRPRQHYHREIITVKQETDTRAIVITKVRNITPAAPDAVDLGEFSRQLRKNGRRIDYIVERDSTGWKVVQARMSYGRQDPTEEDSWFEPARNYIYEEVFP